MHPLDIDAVKTRLGLLTDGGSKPLLVARSVNLYEEEMEVHRGDKSDFESIEDFVVHSIWNMQFVATLEDAMSELSDMDGEPPENRVPLGQDIKDICIQLSPLSWAMPPTSQIESAQLLFNTWNCKWLLMETNAGLYVSAKWFTAA